MVFAKSRPASIGIFGTKYAYIVKKYTLAVFVALALFSASASAQKTENVIVVMMDGLRWQEIFHGADSLLCFDPTATYNREYAVKRFWAPTEKERRNKLTPFFWSTLATKGFIAGNRDLGNEVNVANNKWFSYPGYNETFTGFPDSTVDSNDKIYNKNETVFEYLNKDAAFKGKTAVIASWELFSYIFNEKRSNIYVNDGLRELPGKNEKEKELNKWQQYLPDLYHGSERMDASTAAMSLYYLKQYHPRLFFMSLGNTDEFAHSGEYDLYLDAIHHADRWIKEIWELVESDPFYKGKTALLITTDHGRGYATGGKWQSHGSQVPHANEIWMAGIGAGIKARGELTKKETTYQAQIAATIAELLGKKFQPAHKVLPPLVLQ